MPFSLRIRGELYNELMEAADTNDRSLGNEAELRIEQSFQLSERLDRLEKMQSLILLGISAMMTKRAES